MLKLISNLKQRFLLGSKFWLAIILISLILSITIPLVIDSDLGVIDQNAFGGSNVNCNLDQDQLDILTQNETSEYLDGSVHFISFITPLYSKLNTTTLFGNTSRLDIYTLITDTPGITLSSITRELKLKTGTVSHHLRILEREGYIKSKKTGKFRRYYLDGIKTSEFNEMQEKIIKTIDDKPGLTQSEIAKELSISRQLVNFHIKELSSLDIVKLEKSGNKTYCFNN